MPKKCLTKTVSNRVLSNHLRFNRRYQTAIKESLKSAWAVPALKGTPRQFIVPHDPKLGQKLGLTHQSILITAGCYGDWAAALTPFATKVTYTDASQGMVQIARQKHARQGISRFKQSPAELLPRFPKTYDWTFSFEPYPLNSRQALPLEMTLVRSLLNRKGCMIVRDGLRSDYESFPISRIASIYGAKTVELTQEINGTRFDDSTIALRKIKIQQLKTNALARQRAELDLRLIRFLDKDTTLSLETLARMTRSTPRAVQQGINRLNQWFYRYGSPPANKTT